MCPREKVCPKQPAVRCARSQREASGGSRSGPHRPGALRLEAGRREADPCLSHFSNREFQRQVQTKRANEKRDGWFKEAGLQEQLTKLPSAKTPDPARMREHIEELFQILGRLLQLNGQRRVRSQKFSQCRRQIAMDKICLVITAPSQAEGDQRPVVVAFGPGMFSRSRGHCPGPGRSVRTALRRRGGASCATRARSRWGPCSAGEVRSFAVCVAVQQRDASAAL